MWHLKCTLVTLTRLAVSLHRLHAFRRGENISQILWLERLYVNGKHDLFIVTERNFQIGTGKYKCLTCYELLDFRKMIAAEPLAKLVQQE